VRLGLRKRDKDIRKNLCVNIIIIKKKTLRNNLLGIGSSTDKRIQTIDISENLIKKSDKSTTEQRRSVTYISIEQSVPDA
jgi:hypothetical protein